MLRKTRVLATSFALLAFTAALAPAAHALPHIHVHRHPDSTQQDSRVTVHLLNPNAVSREVVVGAGVMVKF